MIEFPRTHTIRHGKDKHAIITFTPKFMNKLIASNPRAACLVVSKIVSYNKAFEKSISIYYEQVELLNRTHLEKINKNSLSWEADMIDHWFTNGIRILNLDTNLWKILDICNEFYNSNIFSKESNVK